MPIVLLRVDERLIHGQVVVGWGNQLRPDRIIVVDDDLAASAWEQELYVLGLPPHIEAEFDSVADARAQMDVWRSDARRTIVLTRDIASMRRLSENGAIGADPINIGGIHYAPGRTQVLPYVFLNEAERSELLHLAEGGARIDARDLPGTRPIDLVRILSERPYD